MQNCLFLSSHVTLTKFIPIVPNTPRHHDHKLHNFFSQPLSKFQVPQENNELGKHPPFSIKQDPVSFYTTSFSQFHNAYPLLLGLQPHAAHIGSLVTRLWYRLAFVGNIFLLALLAKDLTLLGILSRHKVFQKPF